MPGITVGMDGPVAYLRAGVPVRRAVRVRVQSAYPDSARVLVKLLLPRGLVADSVERWRTLRAGRGAELTFLVRGALPAGAHPVAAVAYHEGTASVVGYGTVAYDHITPQRLYGRAMLTLSAVPVVRPAGCCSMARRTWGALPVRCRSRCSGRAPRRASRARRRR